MELVLLPGLDGTGRLFAPLLQALPAHLRPTVVRYPPDVPLSYPALRERVRAELPRDGPYLLVGESFSGPVALWLAATAPEGLRGVVLAGSFVRSPAPLSALLAPFAAWVRMPTPAWALRLALAGRDAPASLCQAVHDAVTSVDRRVLAQRAQEVLRVDARAALRACPAPLLYLAGRRDLIVPLRVARSLRRLRPDLELHVLDAPHLILQRQAAVAAELIAAFAARCAARPRDAGGSI